MRVRPRRFFFLSPLPLTCASPTGGARRGGLAGKRAGSPRLAPSLREGGLEAFGMCHSRRRRGGRFVLS